MITTEAIGHHFNGKPSKEWLNRKEAAIHLANIGCPISVRTLEKWASHNNAGKGPPFMRIRWKIVRYSRADLEAWAYREVERVI